MSGVIERRRVAGTQPTGWTPAEQAALEACVRAMLVAIPTRRATAIGRRVREVLEAMVDAGEIE